MQIMKVLLGKTDKMGWANHPAVRMWRGHEYWLMRYQTAVIREWTTVRGYRDSCWAKTMALFEEMPLDVQRESTRPDWLGSPPFHIAHQSNLIRKEMEQEARCIRDGRTIPSTINRYRDAFPGVPHDLEYVWPK